jgi:CBS domain containing-hemolysin-like protein
MSTLPFDEHSQTSSPRWLDRILMRMRVRVGLHSPREELFDALAESTPNADFSPQERAMLQNILKLKELRVGDVMVPRADIIAIPAEMPLGEVLKSFREAGHSRLPVYGENLDDPRGMIHIRDFVDYIATCAEKSPTSSVRRRKMDQLQQLNLANVDLSQTLAEAKILRPVLYTPPSMPALDLLTRMQATRTHMALVIDEYGGTDGLISIEDLVEMVVGDIEDEHDDDGPSTVEHLGNDTYIVDARTSLEDAAELMNVNFKEDDVADGVDTLAGLITTFTGRVPARGEVVQLPFGWECDVLDADARRIKRLRIHIRREASQKNENSDVKSNNPLSTRPVIFEASIEEKNPSEAVIASPARSAKTTS